jgi:hypothetical protein
MIFIFGCDLCICWLGDLADELTDYFEQLPATVHSLGELIDYFE